MNGVIKRINHDIDLGGIAKGWSVDKIATIAKEWSMEDGLVNAGGDLFVWGVQERTIGVQHPDPALFDHDIIQIDIRNGGIATSNRLFRSWMTNGKRVNHIFNGQKGVPSTTDIVQATVFSTNTTEADVLAKILCMHSFHDAIPWLAKNFPHSASIVINNAGKIAISQNIKNYVSRIVI